MSTKIVDLVKEEVKAVEVVQEEDRMASMGAYMDRLLDKERAIIISIADKRNRSINDDLSQAEPPPH